MSTPTADTIAMVDAAVMYASDGVRVFPVCPKTKKPLIEKWQSAATTDREQIVAWWARRPNAMIGAATGGQSGFFALDIDRKPGVDGFASLAELEAQHGELPDTFRVRTPSGGEHKYFRYPEGVAIGSRASDIAPGIDTRGAAADGSSTGYVVLPPSVREDGREYKAIDASDAMYAIDETHAPPWLVFLAVFNRRERDELGAIGITASAAFDEADPATWRTFANEALARAWGAPSAADGQALDRGSEDKLLRYVRSAIARELKLIPDAANGEQDSVINIAGMNIHSLLKGARLFGADADVVDEIEATTRDEYRQAVVEMQSFKSGDPWTVRAAEAKWRRTRDDAAPRNLSSVVAQQSDADADFGDVELGKPAHTTKKRVFYFSEDTDDAVIDWLLDETIPEVCSGLFIGDPGSGKTFLVKDLALSVACGVPFFGREMMKRGGVHIVAAEGGYAVQQRLQTAADNKFAKMELPSGVDVRRLPITYEKGAPDLITPKGLAAFLGQMREVQQRILDHYGAELRLVVIDTFGQAFTIEDENSAANIAKATQAMQRIAGELGVAVMAVHHYGKSKGAGPRGSSALTGNADFILAIENKGEIKLTKCRDATTGVLGHYVLEPVAVGSKPNGDPITSCYIREPTEFDDTLQPRPNSAEQTLDESFDAALEARGQDQQPDGKSQFQWVLLDDVRREFYARWEGSDAANSQAFVRARKCSGKYTYDGSVRNARMRRSGN